MREKHFKTWIAKAKNICICRCTQAEWNMFLSLTKQSDAELKGKICCGNDPSKQNVTQDFSGVILCLPVNVLGVEIMTTSTTKKLLYLNMSEINRLSAFLCCSSSAVQKHKALFDQVTDLIMPLCHLLHTHSEARTPKQDSKHKRGQTKASSFAESTHRRLYYRATAAHLHCVHSHTRCQTLRTGSWVQYTHSSVEQTPKVRLFLTETDGKQSYLPSPRTDSSLRADSSLD